MRIREEPLSKVRCLGFSRCCQSSVFPLVFRIFLPSPLCGRKIMFCLAMPLMPINHRAGYFSEGMMEVGKQEDTV